jgi:hypothetical protein
MLNVVMLRFFKLDVIMLNVIMLNVIKLKVIMLNVTMLNVVMENVVMLNLLGLILQGKTYKYFSPIAFYSMLQATREKGFVTASPINKLLVNLLTHIFS